MIHSPFYLALTANNEPVLLLSEQVLLFLIFVCNKQLIFMSLLNGNNKGKGKKGAKATNNNNAAANKFAAGKGNSKGAGNKGAIRTGGTRGS
jgi:hypothetical protein